MDQPNPSNYRKQVPEKPIYNCKYLLNSNVLKILVTLTLRHEF